MRIPLAVTIESRDGGLTRDAKVLNGVVEARGDQPVLRKRPGTADLGLINAGTAQLLTVWNGIKTIQADFISAGTIATIVSAPVQTNLTPANAGLQFTAQSTTGRAAVPYLFFKNRTKGWVINRAGTVTGVTYGSTMGAGTYTVLGITRSGATATATMSEDAFNVGDSVTVAGAVQAAYNGTFTVTAVTASRVGGSVPLTITRVGTTATAVSATPHGLTNGTYTLSGATQTQYNGSFAITVVDTTSFTFTVTVTGTGPDSDLAVTLTRSGTTVTAITASAHGLSTSNTITIAGATDAGYNGSHVITVIDTLTFTFTVTVTPEAPVSPATGSPTVATWTDYSTYGFGSDYPPTGNFFASLAPGHTFANGDTIIISGLTAGAAPLNGTYTIFSVTSNSFQFTGPAIYVQVSGFGSISRPSAPAISSITRASGSTTAVVNFSSAHRFYAGDSITISGATQTQYNGTFAITVVSSTRVNVTVTKVAESPLTPDAGVVAHTNPLTPATGSPTITISAITAAFSYTVAGSPATPATGTITVQGTGGTVPGVPYIDGRFCVMDTNGVIWSSADDDPTSWNALHFVVANNEPGAGKALAKSQNYLIAFKEYSTEFFFFDANSNPAGSPFSAVPNGFTLVGCANGDSVADVGGSIAWVAQSKYAPGRSVYLMTGLQQQKISTPDVERVLNADPLTSVYSLSLNLDGHALYVLTLPSSNVTLVYDLSSQHWGEWSSLTLNGSSSLIFDIFSSNGVATLQVANPSPWVDGDVIKITGADQTEYNGVHQLKFVSADSVITTFTYPISGSPASPATPIFSQHGTGYTESYFKYTKAANYNGTALLLHETNGHIYQMLSSVHQDNGAPINLLARTARLDGGSLDPKRLSVIRVVGDAVDDVCAIRWSDDDCQSFKTSRSIDLSLERPEARRCGAFKRRTIELRHTGNTAPTISAIELEID
jgi:hypothetical protein